MRINDLIDSAGETLFAIDDGAIFFPRVNPAQITSDQNDYLLGAGTVFRFSTDANRNITGFDATLNSLKTGRYIIAIQISNFDLTLKNQSASSIAGNRIICPGGADLVLAQNEAAILWLDLTTSRWRAFKLSLSTTPLTFSATLTGCTTSPSGTARYTVSGNVVTMTLPSLSGTSNANTLTYTGLPAAIQPTSIQYFTVPSIQDNSAFVTLKTDVSVTSSGTITFQIGDSPTGFTNSGTKGIGHVFTITYQLQ